MARQLLKYYFSIFILNCGIIVTITVGYFQGGYFNDTRYSQENFVSGPLYLYSLSHFTGKIFTNGIQFTKIVKIFPSKILLVCTLTLVVAVYGLTRDVALILTYHLLYIRKL